MHGASDYRFDVLNSTYLPIGSAEASLDGLDLLIRELVRLGLCDGDGLFTEATSVG